MLLDIEDLENDNPYFIPDKYRSTMTYIVRYVLSVLNGYSDYVATLPIDEEVNMPLYEAVERYWCLEYLAQNKIAKYAENKNSDVISVINRYNLEVLALILNDEKDNITKLPNLVYYQPTTGRGFVNGNPIKLKKLNKRLFDTLFMAAPEPASRDKLRKAIRSGRDRNTAGSYDIDQAFSNLRKACKVNSKVITLRDSGFLNAMVFKLEDSFFSNDYPTD